MAIISGKLMYDINRTAALTAALDGIANVPIVLQNTGTRATLGILTGADGGYVFNNVPDGNYQIVESYGFKPTSTTPGDFANAVPAALLSGGTVPPLSYINNPSEDATHLDCTTPNTLLVAVSGSDLTGNNFLNGPVAYIPITSIMDDNIKVLPANLITLADNGTFGNFPAGSKANTGADPNPYPDIGTNFLYTLPNPSLVTPTDGQYTVQNLMNNAFANDYGSWWRVADRTTGNETGRMMVINGDYPGSSIFKELVSVKPGTHYMFSAWILNIIKLIDDFVAPALGVKILSESGETLYDATLGNLIPVKTTNPEWKQIGTVIFSGESSTLTVEFVSMGPWAKGNDYIIDDIILNEVEVPVYQPVKTVNKPEITVGDTVTYTVVLEKTGLESLTAVFFKDVLPQGMSFVQGSVVINGISAPDASPNDGFSVPDIKGGSALTVEFTAKADSVPLTNPTLNKAQITYSYTPIEGGIPGVYNTSSNEVPVKILSSDLMITKTTTSSAVTPGGELIYKLIIKNNGPDKADNVVIADTLPPSLTDAAFSIDGGVSFNAWTGKFTANMLEPGKTIEILIKATVKEDETAAIKNTATVSSDTFDPDPENNSSSTENPVSASADLSITKTAQAVSVKPGDEIVYTLKILNSGPSTAQNVIVTDKIPSGLSNARFSLDNGSSWNNWSGSYSVLSIASGNSVSFLISAVVNQAAADFITNTATVESSTPDPDLENNTSTITTVVITPMQEIWADLAIVKTARPNPVTAGELLTYTIAVTNNGPDEAVNAVLIDSTATNLLNPEFSTNAGARWQAWNGSYALGNIANGASVTVLIRGTVSLTATGIIANTAVISSATPDPDFKNNTSTIETPVIPKIDIADVSITKTVNQTSIKPGDQIIYTLKILNSGPSDAQDVVVADKIPSGLSNARFSLDNGSSWKSWKGSYSLGTLAGGKSVSIVIAAVVNQNAAIGITNTATVTSSTPDPDISNNISTITTAIVTPMQDVWADLAIVKTARPNPGAAGELLTYTLTVTNNGPDEAVNAVLIDSTATNLLNPEFSTNAGASWQAWNGSYALGNIANGASVTVLIRGTASLTASGIIANTAVISSATPDPDFENNTSTIETPVAAIIDTADLYVTKIASSDRVSAGDSLNYTITVLNQGPAIAKNVIISDSVPNVLTQVQFSTDNGLTWNNWSGLHVIESLEVDESFTVVIKGTVSSMADGAVENTVIVRSVTPDPDLTNNEYVETTQVASRADLSVVKLACRNAVAPCENLLYTIIISNAGPNRAEDVLLTDNISSKICKPMYSVSNGLLWHKWKGSLALGNIAADSTKTVLIKGTVDTCASGKIKNTATVSSRTEDSNSNNNTSTVTTEICG